MKRQRGRNRNKSNQNNNNRNLDSNGPDVKVRGSASHIYEKYTTLARDAAANGSRVKAENYRQHAEHYLRLVNIQEAAKQAAQAAREEADAARAARAERNDDDAEGENNNEGRRARRYPPRVKRSRDNGAEANKDAGKTDENSKEADAPEGLELVKPEAETAQPEVKRRRKAPTRKKPAPTEDGLSEDVAVAE